VFFGALNSFSCFSRLIAQIGRLSIRLLSFFLFTCDGFHLLRSVSILIDVGLERLPPWAFPRLALANFFSRL